MLDYELGIRFGLSVRLVRLWLSGISCIIQRLGCLSSLRWNTVVRLSFTIILSFFISTFDMLRYEILIVSNASHDLFYTLHIHNLAALRRLPTCRLKIWKLVTWFGPCVWLVREFRGFIRAIVTFCCLSFLKWRVIVRSCLTIILSFFLSSCVMLSRSQIVQFNIIVSVLLDHINLLFFRNLR
jgi:hypothetical protein